MVPTFTGKRKRTRGFSSPEAGEFIQAPSRSSRGTLLESPSSANAAKQRRIAKEVITPKPSTCPRQYQFPSSTQFELRWPAWKRIGLELNPRICRRGPPRLGRPSPFAKMHTTAPPVRSQKVGGIATNDRGNGVSIVANKAKSVKLRGLKDQDTSNVEEILVDVEDEISPRLSEASKSAKQVSIADAHNESAENTPQKNSSRRPQRRNPRVSYVENTLSGVSEESDSVDQEAASDFNDISASASEDSASGSEDPLADEFVSPDSDATTDGMDFEDTTETVKKPKEKAPGRLYKPREVLGIDQNLPPLDKVEDIFTDMTSRALGLGLTDAVTKLEHQTIHIATMCSGTESPLIAMELLSQGLERQGSIPIRIQHHFSAEIDVVKQAYIERNFQPRKLFRDVREFSLKDARSATTAYGAKESIPGNMDILVVGFVCKDLSGLNNSKKTLEDGGESGDTWNAVYSYTKRFRPKIVLVENVMATRGFWNKFQSKYWERIGYESSWLYCDTKNYSLPQTRLRTYMIAIDRNVFKEDSKEVVEHWQDTMRKLERRYSSPYEDFLEEGLDQNEYSTLSTEPDWALCELRHAKFRSEEKLGIARPVTQWSKIGTIRPPDNANRSWYNSQSTRVHDFLDIYHLHVAKEDADSLHKMTAPDVSQNIDRVKPTRGLVSCITPSGCNFATNLQRPITGVGSLILQGIPYSKLHFARETFRDLQDMAGNAMSTTVIGASLISTLVSAVDGIVDVSNTHTVNPPGLDTAKGREINLIPPEHLDAQTLLPASPRELDMENFVREANLSSQMCRCENSKQVSNSPIHVCNECGHTACIRCAGNPTHSYRSNTIPQRNLTPDEFEKAWRPRLPARIKLASFPKIRDYTLDHHENELLHSFADCIDNAQITAQPFILRHFERVKNGWVIHYVSQQATAELHVNATVRWYIFAKCPSNAPGKSPLRKALKSPVARGSVNFSLLNPKWEMCLPKMTSHSLQIGGSTERIRSWKNRLGLPDYQDETVPLRLTITDQDNPHPLDSLTGEYMALPQCGTATASLYKRASLHPLYLFLESDPIGPGVDDSFVFNSECLELNSRPNTTRVPLAILDKSWRPWGVKSVDSKVTANIPHQWIPATITLEAITAPLEVAVARSVAVQNRCAEAITVLDVRLDEPIDPSDFTAYAWALEQAKLLPSLSNWQPVDCSADTECDCSPSFPHVLWNVTADNIATAHENLKEAASFERAVKTRPPIINIVPSTNDKKAHIRIGLNISSLVHRAKSKFSLIGPMSSSWRLTTHYPSATATPRFPKFRLRGNNSSDPPYVGPLRFAGDYQLGKAQRQSLKWMKSQEDGRTLTVVEVEEAIHAGLGWRVEACAKSDVVIRGGVLADLPSFGKTVTTIALVQSEFEEKSSDNIVRLNRNQATDPDLIELSATLIVTPPTIAEQWRTELERFLGEQFQTPNVILVERFSDLQRLEIEDFQNAKVVIVSWSIFSEEKYIAQMADFGAMPLPATTVGRAFDAWLSFILKEMPNRIAALQTATTDKDLNEKTKQIFVDRLARPEFQTEVPYKLQHGNAYESFSAMQAKKSTTKTKKRASSPKSNRYSLRTPLLQMFRFNRVVFDEYHYLCDLKKSDNYAASSVARALAAHKRWVLSGTPALANFSDINQMASFLGVRLGRDVFGDGSVTTQMEKRLAANQTAVEKFLSRTENMSHQWHQARHQRAQEFLDQFVRQNEASLEHIACVEAFRPMSLSVPHGAVYLELSQHLIAQRMQIKKLHNKSRSDRLERLNASLNDSATAEEALLKSALLFETEAGESDVEMLMRKRRQQRKATETELLELIAGFQRMNTGMTEVKDHFESFKRDVISGVGFGDEQTRQTLRRLLKEGGAKNTSKTSTFMPFKEAMREAGKKKQDKLKLLLSQLRYSAEELTLRLRSERFINVIKELLPAIVERADHQGYKCSSLDCAGNARLSELFVISHCGHTACIHCLEARKDVENCVYKGCGVYFQPTNLVRISDLGSAHQKDNVNAKSYGKKLDAVTKLILDIPETEQGVVFAPNQGAVFLLKEIFDYHGIKCYAVTKGRSASRLIEDFKTNADPNERKKVLILNLMDESAAGINLVNANHVIFVSPLLTKSQYEYDSAMAQAIARSRRYRQEKKVFIYHFAALHTIDVDVLEHRHKRFDALQEPGSRMVPATLSKSKGKEKTKLVRNTKGAMALVPRSWLMDDKKREAMKIGAGERENFTSLINFSETFEDDKE